MAYGDRDRAVRLGVYFRAVRAQPRARSLLAIGRSMKQRLAFKDVTVDFPIYDASSRSLKHRLVLAPVANLVSSSSVGGSVHRNSQGVVIVRALDRIDFELADGDRVAIFGHN